MLNRREVCAFLSLIVLVCGCNGNAQTASMSKKNEVVMWPELAELQKPEVGMAIFLNAQRGDTAAVKKAASEPKFKEVVDKLDSTPIPSKFASPAREQAKKKLVEELKKLIAGTGSAKEIKESAFAARDAIGEVTKP